MNINPLDMNTVVTPLEDIPKGVHPSRNDENLGSNNREYRNVHLRLPITKEHLSDKDRIVWQKGCLY